MNKVLVVWSFLLSVSVTDAAIVTVIPPTSAISVGDTFSVNVDITGIADLYAYQFDLDFDPSALSAVSIKEGNFLQRGGVTFYIPGTIDNTGGSIVSTADSLLGSIPGVSGDGILAIIEFKALTPGTSLLTFNNQTLLDSTLSDITASTSFEGTSVSVVQPSAIPEPNTATVVYIGSLLLVLIRHRQNANRQRESSD